MDLNIQRDCDHFVLLWIAPRCRYWPEPDSFIPERFAKENDDKRKPKAFYPFGGGPRLCIGNNFAMAEMAIFLQTMIHSFEINPTEIHPKPNPLVTLRPDRVMLEIKKPELLRLFL